MLFGNRTVWGKLCHSDVIVSEKHSEHTISLVDEIFNKRMIWCFFSLFSKIFSFLSHLKSVLILDRLELFFLLLSPHQKSKFQFVAHWITLINYKYNRFSFFFNYEETIKIDDAGFSFSSVNAAINKSVTGPYCVSFSFSRCSSDGKTEFVFNSNKLVKNDLRKNIDRIVIRNFCVNMHHANRLTEISVARINSISRNWKNAFYWQTVVLFKKNDENKLRENDDELFDEISINLNIAFFLKDFTTHHRMTVRLSRIIIK